MGKKPTRYFSSLQEEHIARMLDGKCQPNSGATPFFKGDVVAGDFLVECKTTTVCKESFSIKEEWLSGLNGERIQMRKPYCALAFQFAPQDSMKPFNKNYFVVDEDTFLALYNAYAAIRESR